VSADRDFMLRAIALALQGRGGTSPNPIVGALVVRAGEVVGEGWHRRAGEPHAEPLALAAAGERARGATLYVTLEPCCHRGGGKRTPPCVDAVIASGVARVVVAMLDPNPRVAGQGVAALRAAGIAVEVGLLEQPARAMNMDFVHWITTQRPYVRLKLAQSLDGRIARVPGQPNWVTGADARRRVHLMRATSDAILVGRGTAAVDDPQLTARYDGPAAGVLGDWLPPLRVVVDTHLTIGPDAKAYQPVPGGAAVVTTVAADDPRARRLQDHGVTVVTVAARGAGVDLRAALTALRSERGQPLTSVLVEGGGTLAAALVSDDLVDELVLHVAPVVYGAGGVPAFGPLPDERRFTSDGVLHRFDDGALELRLLPRRGA